MVLHKSKVVALGQKKVNTFEPSNGGKGKRLKIVKSIFKLKPIMEKFEITTKGSVEVKLE